MKAIIMTLMRGSLLRSVWPDLRLDPAFLLKSFFELIADLLGGLVGTAPDLGFATLFVIRFHTAGDDEAHRIVGGQHHCQAHARSGGLAAAGVKVAGTNFAQSVGSHLETFDGRLELR